MGKNKAALGNNNMNNMISNYAIISLMCFFFSHVCVCVCALFLPDIQPNADNWASDLPQNGAWSSTVY